MKKILSTVVLGSLALTAMAAINPDDYIDMEFGKPYELKQYGSFHGKVTAPETGSLIEYGTVGVYLLGDDGELAIMADPDVYQYMGYLNGKQAYQIKVTEGTTYYFSSDFLWDNGTLTIEMNPALKTLVVDPADGELYDPAGNAYFEFQFNQNVTVGSADMAVGDTKVAVNTIVSGSYCSVDINGTLQDWYNTGLVRGGEIATVTLHDVMNMNGINCGDVASTFKVAPSPKTMTAHSIPSPIRSYWPESCPESKMSFTFSGDIQKNPKVQLCYAPVDLGYEYYEDLDAQVEGNVITVDLAGKRRASADMSTTGREDTSIYVRLIGIKDSDGQYVWSEGQGTVGSYLYTIEFLNLPKLEITAGFTPVNGSDLKDETEVKIYFNQANNLTWDGVQFTSGDESVIIEKKDVKVETISESECELTVSIPAGWSEKENVEVCVLNLMGNEGYDHSTDVKAKYNGFTVTFVNPAADSKLYYLDNGRSIVAETNQPEGEQLRFAVADSKGKAIYGPVTMKYSDGRYVHEMSHEVRLTINCDYYLVFTTAKGESERFVIHGLSPEYEYSACHLSSVSPEEGSSLNAGDKILLTFDGLVKLSKMDGSVDFTAKGLTADDEQDLEGNSNEWELTPSIAALADGEFQLVFYAYDPESKRVQGNVGEESSSHFVLKFVKGESGIFELETPCSQHGIYDLQGHRILTPTPGHIYIINGHKVLVK